MDIKINEQIAFLRKQRGMTQEELASALGVTNQSVSKWENNICCPDIQLLPKIAELFNVSVDALLGYKTSSENDDVILQLKEKFCSLSEKVKADFAFRAVTALHVLVFSDYLGESNNPISGFNINDAMEHAANSEWGYSSFYAPELTTTMRKSSVFFSDNKNVSFTGVDISRICGIIKAFFMPDNLKIAAALYQLTVFSEDIFVSAEEISEKSGLSQEKVKACILGDLLNFLSEKEGEESRYRFEGMYMNILPILLLLGI